MKRKLIIIALVVALVAMFSMPATLFAEGVITSPAGISITKVADITTAYPGDTITYTITVTNTGGGTIVGCSAR